MQYYFDREMLQAELREKIGSLGIKETTAEDEAGLKRGAITRMTIFEPRIDAVVSLCAWLKRPIHKFVKER